MTDDLAYKLRQIQQRREDDGRKSECNGKILWMVNEWMDE